MKNKKLLMLSLLALTPIVVSSCDNKPNSSESSTSESTSSSSSESVSDVTVVINFDGARSNITLTLKPGGGD